MLKILNLGAGVQSTTVYLKSCLGELPKLDCAIFADTQWEPAAVYRHLEWLEREIAPKYGIPIHRVTQGNLRVDMLAWKSARVKKVRRARMPLFLLSPDGSKGMIDRQCTSNYKVRPIERFIKTEILGLAVKARFPTEPAVQEWFGISVDEYRRCHYPQSKKSVKVRIGSDLFGEDVYQTEETMVPIRWRTNYYPLCDREFHSDGTQTDIGVCPTTRDGCQRWLAVNGFPPAPRSACIGCPFHSDAEWLRIQEVPEEWEDACSFDDAIRDCDSSIAGGVAFDNLRGKCYLHADRVPLREVYLDPKNDMPMFQCSDGICGV